MNYASKNANRKTHKREQGARTARNYRQAALAPGGTPGAFGRGSVDQWNERVPGTSAERRKHVSRAELPTPKLAF